MALRKSRRKKNDASEMAESVEVLMKRLEEQFDDNMNVAELNLIKDLNSSFFASSYDLVQRLCPINVFAAGKMKQYVDILARIHARYTEEVASSAKVQSKVDIANEKLKKALEITSTSNDMIERMRESLAEAWRTADAAQLREAMMYGNIDYAYNYNSSKQGMDSDAAKTQAEMRLRGVVFRERDRLARELKDHQKRLEINRVYSESLESIVNEHRHTISRQQARVKYYESEVFKLEHKFRVFVESYEERINQQKKEIESLSLINQSLRIVEKKHIECKALNENMKLTIDKLFHDNLSLQKINHRSEEEIFHVKNLVTSLENENRALRREKSQLESRVRANIREFKKKEEIYLMLNRRFRQLAKKNSELNEQQMLLKNQLTAVEKKLLVVLAQLDETQHYKEEGDRQREKLRGEISSLNDGLASLRYDLANQRSRTQDVQFLLDRAHIQLDEKDAKVHKITKERNELLVETNGLNKTIETLEDHVADKTLTINKLQEQLQLKIHEFQGIKQQMETIHAEKTLLQKSFGVCGQDRQTLQSINGKQAFQIDQLCTQVSLHEKDTNSLNKKIDQLNSQIKHKMTEIHLKDRLLKSTRAELLEVRMHSAQLQNTIEDDEKRFKMVTNILEDEKKSKNLVGQQMMRRNGELSVLQEKLTMMQLALSRGTLQYNQRIEDIRLLKTEITNIRMSKDCLERAVSSTVNMRREVMRLERHLVRERLHVAALTEEMKHPYRIHRWRVIRGTDPHKYELICKIQALLKRNIRLTVERRNLENKVQDVQRLYDTLKQEMKYVPDPGVKERLLIQQRINKRQSRKVRAMKAELAINEIDLQTRDVIIDEYQNAFRKQKKPNQSIINAIAGDFKEPTKFTDPTFNSSSSS